MRKIKPQLDKKVKETRLTRITLPMKKWNTLKFLQKTTGITTDQIMSAFLYFPEKLILYPGISLSPTQFKLYQILALFGKLDKDILLRLMDMDHNSKRSRERLTQIISELNLAGVGIRTSRIYVELTERADSLLDNNQASTPLDSTAS